MTSAPFINVDCQWLDDLGQTFIADDDLATGMRLRDIAKRFQSIDQRLLTLSADNGQFIAGRQSVWDELAAKSNLPDDASHHVRKIRPKIDESKVRKMPAHKTTSQLQAAEIAKQINEKRAVVNKEKFAGLSGLKLNLEVLKK